MYVPLLSKRNYMLPNNAQLYNFVETQVTRLTETNVYAPKSAVICLLPAKLQVHALVETELHDLAETQLHPLVEHSYISLLKGELQALAKA